MKPLNVRFDNSSLGKLSEMASKGVHSKSDIARAALQIGIKKLESCSERELSGRVNIAKMRAMLSDDDSMNEFLESKFDS